MLQMSQKGFEIDSGALKARALARVLFRVDLGAQLLEARADGGKSLSGR